jgi:hypothetical protein
MKHMDTASVASPPMIIAVFVQHHGELDEIIADVEFLSRRGSYVQAAKRFGEFRRALERQMGLDEHVLLPLLIERTGDPSTFAPVLRAQHAHLFRLLNGLGSALSQSDHAGFCGLARELQFAMKAHQLQEQRMLTPMLCAVANSDQEWDW